MKLIFNRSLFFLFFAHTALFAEVMVIGRCKNTHMGFFASANSILGQLYLYEKGSPLDGIIVDYAESGLYYDPAHGRNWWNYYFEPIQIGAFRSGPYRYQNKKEHYYACLIRRFMHREQASALVKKYIRPLPWIQQRVDSFVADRFQDAYVLGIHYRGTDKEQEAPRLSYNDIFSVVDDLEKESRLPSNFKIFVATDEAGFLEEVQKRYPNRVLAAEAERATGKVGVHFLSSRPFEIGAEALVDALLLSRCNLLIRTSSSLSLWSTFFNPDLPVILLNQRFEKTADPE